MFAIIEHLDTLSYILDMINLKTLSSSQIIEDFFNFLTYVIDKAIDLAMMN